MNLESSQDPLFIMAKIILLVGFIVLMFALKAIGDEDLSHEAPIGAVGPPPSPAGAFLDRFPMAGDVGRIEIEAHGNEAALTGKLERVGVLR